MPWVLDERTDQDGPAGPIDGGGAIPRPDVDGTNAGQRVRWVRISPEDNGPTPLWAVISPDHQATARSGSPADTLARELVLDPWFHR